MKSVMFVLLFCISAIYAESIPYNSFISNVIIRDQNNDIVFRVGLYENKSIKDAGLVFYSALKLGKAIKIKNKSLRNNLMFVQDILCYTADFNNDGKREHLFSIRLRGSDYFSIIVAVDSNFNLLSVLPNTSEIIDEYKKRIALPATEYGDVELAFLNNMLGDSIWKFDYAPKLKQINIHACNWGRGEWKKCYIYTYDVSLFPHFILNQVRVDN